jgi:hypothetical protein
MPQQGLASQEHRYCAVHGIAYNITFERVCPQCTLARMAPDAANVLQFDTRTQKPLDKAGAVLDPITLQPVA